ncbi:hypothetical protein MMC22_006889 [Lobaria immixta]|nr:hypothetical protein [Lobaria immixta]
MKAATSERRLRPSTSGLELDPFYSGLELDRNVSGLEPGQVSHGPELTPVECLEQIAPQFLTGTEDNGVVQWESPAGLMVQEPSEDLQKTKSWHRLVVALILFMILIAIVVPVSVRQTRNSSRTTTSGISGPTLSSKKASSTTPSKEPSPTIHSGLSIPTVFPSGHREDYSTSGAFKRTGLAPCNSADQNSSYLFFQHYTGQIRQLVTTDRTSWTGGSNSDAIVGANARNGTPLAAMGSTRDKVHWYHLFYIDTSNLLQDLVHSNESGEWQKGSLGELRLATSESLAVGLNAALRTNVDMTLYFRTKDNLVQEFTYHILSKTWQSGFSFAMSNGNSGILLLHHEPIGYLVCLNSAYQLQVWWKDFNESSIACPRHPVGKWTRGSIATNVTVGHNSSLETDSFRRILYQDPSNKILDVKLDGSVAEFADFEYPESSQDGRNALAAEPNTRTASLRYHTDGNARPSGSAIYLQTNESNIVEYRFEGDDYTAYKTRVIYSG